MMAASLHTHGRMGDETSQLMPMLVQKQPVGTHNQMMDTYTSRNMTPIERKEARMQALLAAHSDRMRKLAFEKQKILQVQALQLGQVDPIVHTTSNAQARAMERLSLIEQLSNEQAATETMLESLKQGHSLGMARRAGLAIHKEMSAIRVNAGQDMSDLPVMLQQTTVSRAGTAATHTSKGTEPAATTGIPAPRSDYISHRHPHFHDDDSSWDHGDKVVSRDVGATAGAGAGAGAGKQQVVRQSSISRRGTHSASKASSWHDSSPVHSHESTPIRQRNDHTSQEAAQAQSTRSKAGRQVSVKQVSVDEGSPAYIQDLKDQVEALRSVVEAQFKQQQQQQQQQQQPPMHAQPQPMMAPMNMPVYHPQQVPVMHLPPPPHFVQQPTMQFPGLMYMQQQGFTQDAGLASAMASHSRDMTLLRMEIERARTAAELEQIRTALTELRAKGGRGGGGGIYDTGPGDMTSFATGLQTQAAVPIATPATTIDQQVMMMDVPPATDLDATTLTDDTGSEGSGFEADDDVLEDKPESMLPSTVVRADVLNVHISSIGPVGVRGTYRVRVVLYDGFQPLYVAPDLVVGASTGRRPMIRKDNMQVAEFNETVTLRGLSLTPTMMLVFELFVAKQALAGMPAREDLTAWSFCQALAHGQVVAGKQSVPFYRLPIMMSAQRHFSYNGAMLEFSVSHAEGEQGDGVLLAEGLQTQHQQQHQATSGMLTANTYASTINNDTKGPRQGPEDIAGVPCAAWMRVTRGTPPAEPFTPGEGFAVSVDGARFLPANCSITKVVVVAFGPDRQALTKAFEAFSQPESDVYNPRYGTQFTLAYGLDKFDNAAATLLFTLYTMERPSGSFRLVGYAALPCFLDPRTKEQPTSKNTRDYILNLGAFQIPIHTALPPSSGGSQFRGSSFQDVVPRVPCASLLLRVSTPDMAKQQRRQPLPLYSDRVYDSMRAQPTADERMLFSKYLTRKPLLVREAARQLAGTQAGGLAVPGAAIPSTDPELLDWMEAKLQPGSSNKGPTQAINFNMASEYYPDLGFYVSVDGAMRLPRNLPAGALVTFAPPGSFYQDNPVLDDIKVVSQLDMSSCLAAPRWSDSALHFTEVVAESGLALLIDVRLLVPGAGSSSPAGWTVLPMFERGGQFVATGMYHLPLFQGVPSRHIIQEFATKGDVDAVVIQQIQSKRLKPHEECCSVLVRLYDASRRGHLPQPLQSSSLNLASLRLPAYVAELGPRFLSMMRKDIQNKTYSEAKPPDLSMVAWQEQMSHCLYKAAGLKSQAAAGSRFDEDEDEDEESVI